MADDVEKKISFDSKVKGLLLPIIVGGAGMGAYTNYVLAARLDAEIKSRESLERRVEIQEDRTVRRLERLEDRINGRR